MAASNDDDDVQVYKLPADRFYATYFCGDEKAGIAPDTESKDIWLRYLPKERFLPFGCKDNFWEMGETGPCGPCTEIHFDRIGNLDATSLVNNDDPTRIEIWNLVFIQFNREPDGTLRPLPEKHVDTGMGFERLASILQNKLSNYDTDVSMPLFDAIHKWTGDGIKPYSGKLGSSDVGKVDTAYRVVADHIRTLSFAIADGSQPGNEGREYVLRRILRRAVHFGCQKLMAKQGFFSNLVDVFVRVMGDVFPELKDNKKKIKVIIKEEEASFENTLAKGFERFKKAADTVRENGGAVLSGQDAFVLWDTYGYPIDLTKVMALDFGLSVDMEGFNVSMEEARQKDRNARYKVLPLFGNNCRRFVIIVAVHFGCQKLMAKQGFFSNLVDVFVRVMGDVFPELKDNKKKIKVIIKEEEASFENTLAKGFERFKKAADTVRENGGAVLSGQDAFVLWDTYGYPIDLTKVMALDFGLSVDMEGFNVSMEEARQKDRNARYKAGGKSIVLDANATSHLRNQGFASTDDSPKFQHEEHSSGVMAIYTGSEFIASASVDEDIGLVLKSTSFYAEQGGQIYDTGSIEGSSGSFTVNNVQVFAGYVLHIGSFVEGSESKALSVGDEVKCKVDYTWRSLIAPNHTCTHLLNFALREVLGDHIEQKGSIVLPEKLRFDFSHGKPVELQELERIELIVNQQIKDELEVSTEEMKLVDAKRINDLRAVFGEIYPDPVRVVSIGREVEDMRADPESKEGLPRSTELCGGTHISNTRVAVAFAILYEEGVAKGVRRITAVTAECASQAMKLASSIDTEIIDASKLDGVALEKKIGAIKSRLDAAAIPATRKAGLRRKVWELEDQMRKTKKKIGQENIQKAVNTAVDAAEAALSAGEPFCVTHVDVGLDTSAVREAVVKCMNRLPIMLFSIDVASNKVVVYAGVPPEAPKGLKAVEWLKPSITPLKGRGGGGKNGLAQGQGNDASRLKEAMEVAVQIARNRLSKPTNYRCLEINCNASQLKGGM